MACQTENEIKRALRKSGMSPEKTAQAMELLKQLKDIKQAGTSLGHIPVASKTGIRQIGEAESVKKYQNEIIKFTKTITGFSVVESENLPIIIDMFTDRIGVAAAYYDSITNAIKVIPEDSGHYIEQAVRSEILNQYFLDHQDLSDAQIEKISMNDAKEYLGIENYDDIVNHISSMLMTKDKMHEFSHEAVHAGAFNFMTNPDNKNSKQMKRIEEIYAFAMSKRDTIERAMTVDGSTDQYWMTNIHEFVAEGLTNPLLINALSKIQYKSDNKLSSIFKEFISALVSMLGIESSNKDSVYEYLLDSYASMLESKVGNLNKNVFMLEKYKTTDIYKDETSRTTDISVSNGAISMNDVLAEDADYIFGTNEDAGEGYVSLSSDELAIMNNETLTQEQKDIMLNNIRNCDK